MSKLTLVIFQTIFFGFLAVQFRVTMTSENVEASILSARWSMQGFTHEEQTVLREVMVWLVEWAKRRGIYCNRDVGFITSPILEVMIAVSSFNARELSLPFSRFSLIKHFFTFFTRWKLNEASVGGDCCGLSNQLDGSVIDEAEGIDSEVDEESRLKRTSLIQTTEPEINVERTGLLSTADDNDEVHPHKRHRYELGQIRDIRRFYDVENDQLRRIAIQADDRTYPSSLDFLDVLSVVDPLDKSVNLSIKVLESHKKLIVQELVRAEMLLSDSVGDDEDYTLGPESEILEKAPLRVSSLYIVFDISAESDEIRSEVADTVEDQSWFLIQEIQAYHGVMVIPISNRNSSKVVVGVNFIKNEPYTAMEGTTIDFFGPLSRVLLRTRKVLFSREDFVSRFSKKFSVKASILRNEEFRDID